MASNNQLHDVCMQSVWYGFSSKRGAVRSVSPPPDFFSRRLPKWRGGRYKKHKRPVSRSTPFIFFTGDSQPKYATELVTLRTGITAVRRIRNPHYWLFGLAEMSLTLTRLQSNDALLPHGKHARCIECNRMRSLGRRIRK